LIICHIIVGLNVGGAEMMLKRLVDSLQMRAIVQRQIVISLTTIGKVGQLLQASGIEVYGLNIGSVDSILPSVWKLYKLIRSIKPDIVQTWMYHADLLGGLVAKFVGCKNIIWGIRITDISIGTSKITPKIRWFCAKLSKKIPRIIVCVAESSREEHAALGYDAKKMVVISNGFDFSFLQAQSADIEQLRVDCHIDVDDIVIGTVFRFNQAKDPYNFVQAAKLIAIQMPRARFLMVGRDCDDKNTELVSRISATGIADRFILLGERNDVPVCLSVMDVFCLPSRAEGLPNALGEAMAMRKLCVSTDAGDAAFLLGDCGVIVPKQSPQALADGVMKLLALSLSERATLSTRAYDRVTTEFTMTKASKQFEAVYNKLLDKSDCVEAEVM
jgi:glycosyltransferase involved in cell wall biosynthesis